jgi:hypothetical protein
MGRRLVKPWISSVSYVSRSRLAIWRREGTFVESR